MLYSLPFPLFLVAVFGMVAGAIVACTVVHEWVAQWCCRHPEVGQAIKRVCEWGAWGALAASALSLVAGIAISTGFVTAMGGRGYGFFALSFGLAWLARLLAGSRRTSSPQMSNRKERHV